MAKVTWTAQSLDDIEAISEFISRDSNYYASLFAKDIFEKVKILETFPKSGRMVPESGSENIREIFYGSYRIIYRIKHDQVEILTIHHGSQILDIPGKLQGS